MGYIAQRGKFYWIQYYRNGQKSRESVRSPRREDAVRLLKLREGEIAQGRIPVQAEKVSFNQLAENFLREYEVNGRRSLGRAKISVAHLKGFFDGWKATAIGTDSILSYVQKRQRAGKASGTINRELAALKRMFKLAVQAGTLLRAPYVTMLEEAPARSGFFEPDQFETVLRQLPPEIQPIAIFGHQTGWRLREILGLQWKQVDLKEGWARLDAGMSKNKQPRLIYLSPDLLEILRAQAEATRALERNKGVIIPWVFHRNGRPIGEFRKRWRRACRLAGVPGRLFHDLRRTAIRNLVRAGVPERVAMQISGHRTRSIFDRYNIVSEGDLKEAAAKLALHRPGHPSMKSLLTTRRT